MARGPRAISESDIYHVMVRGVDRTQLFYDDDDRRALLDRLTTYADLLGVDLVAWCLMGNHVHLLVRCGMGELSEMMRRMLTSYTRYFNGRYDRHGPLLDGRFRSKPVDSEAYLLTVLRYILRNPLDEGHGIDHWTSYDEYMGHASTVCAAFVLSLFADDVAQARRALTAFVTAEDDPDREADGPLLGERERLMDDEKAIGLIRRLASVDNCLEVADKPKGERDRIILQARRRGLTIKQVSRLTGLNRNLVQRAGRTRGGGRQRTSRQGCPGQGAT